MVETTRAQLPAGVVTFLLTDVAGSTEQWEAHPEEMTTVIARHYALLHAAISDHDGVCPVEQGEGDSVVAAFARGSDAVRAALDAQRALAEEPWPDGIDIEVRMALHTGEARLRDEGNYAGETIIRTARLRALAHGSQVIASRACVDLVADLLPPEATWIDLGSYRLRNLERPEQVFQLAHPALRRDFPPLRGLDVVGNNLPTQLTPFIGREAELAQLHALLDDVRLLTLTGSGGCGKTRLALQAAADRVERHRDGVWYVELAPLGETSSVLGTLADVLRVHGSAEQSLLDLVVERLRDARALLVVDNCEHLLDDAAEVIGALLRSCPPLQIVATSRQPLNLPGEVTWRVPSLGAPGPDDAADLDSLDQYDSVRLFVDRAVRARPNFAVTNENAASVAGICSRLDGIPLAIELAAARVRSLPVERIAEGLDDRFRLLRGGSATLLPRQQTLLASVEWSHQLLDEQERTLLRRLALFCGGFTLDAAEAVAAFEPLDPYAVLDHLTNLVDRSLVLLDDEGAEPRYRMLETIKQFSLARLEESDERTDVADRHLAHYAALAAAVAPHLETGAQLAERPRLAVEHDNLRAALVHAASRPEPMPLARLASDLTLYWVQTAHYADADEWLALAAERLGPDAGALLPRLLWGRGYVVYYFGDLVRSTALADAAIVAARAAGDPGIEARAIDLRSDALQFVDPIGTIPALEEGLDLARQAGDRWATVEITQKIGYSYLLADRFREAEVWLERACELGLADDNPFFAAWHHNGIAVIDLRRGASGALERAMAARSTAQASGDLVTIAWAARVVALSQCREGALDEAEGALARCAEDLDRRGGGPIVQWMMAATAVELALWRGAWDAPDALEPWLDPLAEGMVHTAVALTLELCAVGQLQRRDPTVRTTIQRLAEQAAQLQTPLYAGLAELFGAVADLQRGDPGPAAGACRRVLERWQDEPYDIHLAQALVVLAWACAAGGDDRTAGRLLAATDAVREQQGWAISAHEAAWRQEAVTAATDAEALAAGGAEAERLDLRHAVAQALRSRGPRLRPATGWASLTPTELEVADAVVDGLTNPQIAERLFMSRSTVKTHLSHVFAKLDISSRAELAARRARAD